MTGPRTKYTTYSPYGEYTYWDGSTGHKYPNQPFSGGVPMGPVIGKDELLETSGHPYTRLGKGSGDIGGSFTVIKRELNIFNEQKSLYTSGTSTSPPDIKAYIGPCWAAGMPRTSAEWPSVNVPSAFALDSFGTTAIANTIPTNPISGLFVALGELRSEGVPSLLGVESWKSRTFRARQAGSEYLNYEFGWLPLVNDLKKFTHAVRDHDDLIRQYERNSGKRTKRSFTMPVDSNSSVQTLFAYPSGPMTSLMSSSPTDSQRFVVSFSNRTERWFKGAYSYYLPPYNPNGDNVRRNEQLANYLYGTRPTPEGVWNLTPWTWAADWIANTGDVLHNIGAFQTDGLVLHYGYVMHKSIASRTVIHPTLRFHKGGSGAVGYKATTTLKMRRPATPYGFGLNPGTFSDRQWSILTALGLSRGGKQMRYA